MGIRSWFSKRDPNEAGRDGSKSFMLVMQVGEDGFMKQLAFSGGAIQQMYTQAAWTYICASRISQDISSLPAVVQVLDTQNHEWVDDPSHELNALLARPYGPSGGVPPWNWQQMIACGQLRNELGGNQYYREVVGGRKLLGLQLIMDDVRGIEDERGVPTRYKIGNHGNEAPATEIVNVMHPNPGSWWSGISPVVAAEQAIHVDYSIAQRLRYDLEHRVAPGVVFKVKSLFTMNKAQREDEEKWLGEQFGAATKAGKAMVVGDNVTVDQPPTRQVDDMPAHAAAARDVIISAFDVSPPVVGVLRDVKYQSWEQALRAQWALCIGPRAHNLYTVINSQAVWPLYGPTVRIWYDPIQSPLGMASIRERAETAKHYYGFGYPANSINRKFHLGMPYFEELERPNMPSVIAGRDESGDDADTSTDIGTDDDTDTDTDTE